MPDDVPCPCSWMDKAKAIAIVVGAVGGGVIAPIIGVLNHSQNATNHEETTTKIAVTDAKVDTAAATAVEVKKELKVAKESTERKMAETAEKTVAEVKAAMPKK